MKKEGLPKISVVAVAPANTRYEPSLRYLEQRMGHFGFEVETIAPETLGSFFDEAVVREGALEDEPSFGTLFVGSTILGPIWDPTPFMKEAAKHDAYAISVEDSADDPLTTSVPLLYLSQRAMRSIDLPEFSNEVERSCGAEANVDCLIEALRKAIEKAGISFGYVVEESSVSFGDEEGCCFLRDGLIPAIDRGTPFLPWALFTKDPLVLERWAVPTGSIMDRVLALGYPDRVFWATLLRAAPPRVWFPTTGQYRILPEERLQEATAGGGSGSSPVVAIIQVSNLSRLSDLLTSLADLAHVRRAVVYYPKHQEQRENNHPSRFEEAAGALPVEMIPSDPALLANGTAPFLSTRFTELLSEKPSPADGQPKKDEPRLILFLSDALWEVNRASLGIPPNEEVTRNLTASPGYVGRIYKMFLESPSRGFVFAPRPPGLTREAPKDASAPYRHALVQLLGNERESAKQAEESLLRGEIAACGGMFYGQVGPLADVARVLGTIGLSEAADLSSGEAQSLIAAAYYHAGAFATQVQTISSAERQSLQMETRLDTLSRYLYPYAREAVQTLGRRLAKAKRLHRF